MAERRGWQPYRRTWRLTFWERALWLAAVVQRGCLGRREDAWADACRRGERDRDGWRADGGADG